MKAKLKTSSEHILLIHFSKKNNTLTRNMGSSPMNYVSQIHPHMIACFLSYLPCFKEVEKIVNPFHTRPWQHSSSIENRKITWTLKLGDRSLRYHHINH